MERTPESLSRGKNKIGESNHKPKENRSHKKHAQKSKTYRVSEPKNYADK